MIEIIIAAVVVYAAIGAVVGLRELALYQEAAENDGGPATGWSSLFFFMGAFTYWPLLLIAKNAEIVAYERRHAKKDEDDD